MKRAAVILALGLAVAGTLTVPSQGLSNGNLTSDQGGECTGSEASETRSVALAWILDEALHEIMPADFAGLWIDETTDQVHVAVVKDGRETKSTVASLGRGDAY